MNKKITIIILTILLLLSATTSIIAAASLQKETEQLTDVTVDNSTENKALTKTKIIKAVESDQSASEKIVSYSSSEKISDNYTIDIYTDSIANEYMYSPSDELVGYKRHNKTIEEKLYPEKLAGRLENFNKNNVIAYAEEFASNFLGDEFDGYVFEEIQMLGTDIYYVMFKLPAGKDGFISARKCTVCINDDGFIDSCILSKKNYAESSALELMSIISEDDVLDNVEVQLTKLFSDAKDVNIQKVFLADGGDSLRIEVTFTTELSIENKMDGYDFGFNGENSYLIILYYPLS